MNVRLLSLLFAPCLWLLCPASLCAQETPTAGFAGLGSDAAGFTMPHPAPTFDFPKDHGPHPEYRIEWWYLTANLTGEDGRDYGLQWTLFRSALAPEEATGWHSPQIWFAHAAVTTPDLHLATERFARGGIGQAGVTPDPFHAWIDDWAMQGPDLDHLTLTASGPDFRYDMQLRANGPVIFHGDNGFSVKSAEGQASYYYSQPFYQIDGTLQLPDGPVAVTGQAWLDREWSSQPLSESQSGWDWFSLSFDSGDKLMGFVLRDTAGEAYSSATWITPDGVTTAYKDGAFSARALTFAELDGTAAGRQVPVGWRVRLPEHDVDITVTALNPQAWMDVAIPYWEGPVHVTGSHRGRGYLEMTGYE